MDETHPYHDPDAPAPYKTAIRDLYQHIDQWVGRIVETAGEEVNVVIMSDHGAGPLYQDVFLNEWLIQKGWLKLKEEPSGQRHWFNFVRKLGLTRENISDTLTRANLHRVEVLIKRILGDHIQVLPRDERPEFLNAIDWSQTSAYSFGYYGQIFINLKGREPEGIVDPGTEYENLRQEIARGMRDLINPEDGLAVVDRVYFKEELYEGSYLKEAPDLLAIMRDFTYMTRKGYEFADRRGVLFRDPYTKETGSHRLEGILIGAGPDVSSDRKLADYDIQDLTPTLLYLQNCPIPEQMDGGIINELLAEEFKQSNAPHYEDRPISSREGTDGEWSEEAEAEVADRLKKLGYLR
jgi:predicted AlkP superfamily phosphohydrolase/phosphomutase